MNKVVPLIGLVVIVIAVAAVIRFPQYRSATVIIALIVLILSLGTVFLLISSASKR